MTTWDPSQYLKFADTRTRPAADLLARIPLESPRRIADLGCGPGNSTELLKVRWPKALILGVDNSPEMLLAARRDHPDWVWEESDIETWVSEEPLDLIFSNAALHWLPRHDLVLPRLLNLLSKGGVLAVQMPRNHQSAAHRLIREVAVGGPWQGILAEEAGWPLGFEAAGYYALLSPLCRVVEIWETEYAQVMESAAAIAEWMKGSALRPFLAHLGETAQKAFLARYSEALTAAYPSQPDGRVLFPFKRIFFVARR